MKIERAYLSTFNGNLRGFPEGVMEGTIDMEMLGITEDKKTVRFTPIIPLDRRYRIVELIREIEGLVEGTEQRHILNEYRRPWGSYPNEIEINPSVDTSDI